jgi:hypothetical protein
VIKNDPEGFYNYITAPNIRHKVKHPVFLAIKFSNCVKIYYNTKLVENTSNVKVLLYRSMSFSKICKPNFWRRTRISKKLIPKSMLILRRSTSYSLLQIWLTLSSERRWSNPSKLCRMSLLASHAAMNSFWIYLPQLKTWTHSKRDTRKPMNP